MKKLTQSHLFKVLGRKYEPASYGPNAFDCWGLVWFCYKHFYGIEIPKYQGCESSMIKRVKQINSAVNSDLWSVKDEIESGDVILMGRPDKIEHIGLAIDKDHILHVSSALGSVYVEKIVMLKQIHKSIIPLKYEG